MRLRHLHLPNLTSYPRASAIQDYLVRVHLDHKAFKLVGPAPSPVLLTFQTPPTYTCGRREIGRLSSTQINHLKAGGKAAFYEALRGGQTTFHGPGQITAYLILSLQEHKLNSRGHVRLLENSVISTCEHYSLSTHTTENPGVWIGPRSDDRKIASVGVHLRRHIASHGIGLNVSVDLSWFDRIVACGLVGKRATSFEEAWNTSYQRVQMGNSITVNEEGKAPFLQELGMIEPALRFQIPTAMQEIANVFAERVAKGISGLDSMVEEAREEDIWPGEVGSK